MIKGICFINCFKPSISRIAAQPSLTIFIILLIIHKSCFVTIASRTSRQGLKVDQRGLVTYLCTNHHELSEGLQLQTLSKVLSESHISISSLQVMTLVFLNSTCVYLELLKTPNL